MKQWKNSCCSCRVIKKNHMELELFDFKIIRLRDFKMNVLKSSSTNQLKIKAEVTKEPSRAKKTLSQLEF